MYVTTLCYQIKGLAYRRVLADVVVSVDDVVRNLLGTARHRHHSRACVSKKTTTIISGLCQPSFVIMLCFHQLMCVAPDVPVSCSCNAVYLLQLSVLFGQFTLWLVEYSVNSLTSLTGVEVKGPAMV